MRVYIYSAYTCTCMRMYNYLYNIIMFKINFNKKIEKKQINDLRFQSYKFLIIFLTLMVKILSPTAVNDLGY
jgi:hypothetical protein